MVIFKSAVNNIKLSSLSIIYYANLAVSLNLLALIMYRNYYTPSVLDMFKEPFVILHAASTASCTWPELQCH